MSSTTLSECDCYYCQYGTDYQNLCQFYPTMGQPLVYYAEVPSPRGRDRRKNNPNCFVKAFRWYTQERVPQRVEEQSTTTCTNVAGFASWLDDKYEQYLRDNRNEQGISIDGGERTNNGSNRPITGVNRKSRFKSPWRKRRHSDNNKEGGDVLEKRNKSVVYLMEPKELPHPTSDCCHTSPASGISDVTVKKTGQSLCAIQLEIEIAEHDLATDNQQLNYCSSKCKDVCAKQTEGDEVKSSSKRDKNASSQFQDESMVRANTETQYEGSCSSFYRNIKAPGEPVVLPNTSTQTLINQSSKGDSSISGKQCNCPDKPFKCHDACKLKSRNEEAVKPPPSKMTKGHRMVPKKSKSNCVLCQCYKQPTVDDNCQCPVDVGRHTPLKENEEIEKMPSVIIVKGESKSSIIVEPAKCVCYPSTRKEQQPSSVASKTTPQPTQVVSTLPSPIVTLDKAGYKSSVDVDELRCTCCRHKELQPTLASTTKTVTIPPAPSVTLETKGSKCSLGVEVSQCMCCPFCHQPRYPAGTKTVPLPAAASILEMKGSKCSLGVEVATCVCCPSSGLPPCPASTIKTAPLPTASSTLERKRSKYSLGVEVTTCVCCPSRGQPPCPASTVKAIPQAQTAAVEAKPSKCSLGIEVSRCMCCPVRNRELQPCRQTLKANTAQTSDHSIRLDHDTLHEYPLFLKIVCADKLNEECACRKTVCF